MDRFDGDTRTRSLADLALEITEPPEGDIPSKVLTEQPVVFFALGLLQGCRAFLRASCALFDADLESVSAPITRSTMEYAVTGGWLLRDPERNLKRFLRGHLYELDRLDRFDSQQAARSRLLFIRMFGHLLPERDQTGLKLPDFDSRLGKAWRPLYQQYRHLCEEVHPSFVASSLAFDVEGDVDLTVVYKDFGRADSGEHLFFTAIWACVLALEIDAEIGGFPAPLEAGTEYISKSVMDPDEFMRITKRLHDHPDTDE